MKFLALLPLAIAGPVDVGYNQFVKVPSLNDHGGLTNCYWQGGKWGNYYTCQPNQIATGVCGSGRRADCPGGTE